jgi:hypothetical protein
MGVAPDEVVGLSCSFGELTECALPIYHQARERAAKVFLGLAPPVHQAPEDGHKEERWVEPLRNERAAYRLWERLQFSKERLGDGWAYVFRHQTLGGLGRILLQDILDLQDWLGHEDPRTTCNYIRDDAKLHRSPAYVLRY